MQESFLVVFYYCSGGPGDIFRIKGNYFHFETALGVAMEIKKENLRMTSIDHGAYIFRVGLNKTYDTESADHCVFAVRYHPSLGMVKTWFDEKLKRAHFPMNAEEIRQRVIDQL